MLGSGLVLQWEHPKRLFKKGSGGGQGRDTTCTAVRPTRREDCGCDVLSLSALGPIIQRGEK